MSQNDSFMSEVSDEVRRDRFFAALRRYGWIAVVVVLVAVGVAAWSEYRRAGERADAQAFGDAVLAALDADGPEARRTALLDIEADGARRALLAMLAADTLDDPDAQGRTLELLRQIADDDGIPTIYRELATLKAAMLMQGTTPPEDVIAMLEPLTIPGAPYRLLAQEQQAIARIAMGETDAAIGTLRDILQDGAAPRDLQGRVRQLIVALGGTTEPA